MNRENRYRLLKLRGLIAGLLLLLFSAYYINITLFTHYHVVDGVTIVHSHFYSEGHGEEGDLPIDGASDLPSDSASDFTSDSASDSASDFPSDAENHLTLIQMLSNYIAELQGIPIYIMAILLTLQWSYRKVVERAIPTNSYSHPQLRAPPTQILIG
ncbi:MAG: hypothetical protein SNG14_05235 [Rikenellaceae bacterium]